MKKNIILHDTFLYKWGWERLILMMAKALDADLASGFFSKWSFDLRKEWFKWEMISLTDEVFKKWFRHFKLKFAFLFKTKFLKNYENVIFSGDSISAVRNCWKNTKKVYYCHTPPRYLYDLKNIYLKKVPFLLKPAFLLVSYIFRKMYERDISKMDLILTNSINTQKRIKKFLWVDSQILYPPVDLKEFRFLDQKDFYLSFARLADAKRVDRVIEAFKKLPEKKLVVIYGENDPQREKIFELAKWCENIEFKTLPWNIGFTDYVGNCIATIYIPIDEDFWMSPVESMAAGKPVLWINEGWLKETIIDKKTWVLIKAWAEVDAVIFLTPELCLAMKEDCEARAKEFSLEEFEKNLKNFLEK